MIFHFNSLIGYLYKYLILINFKSKIFLNFINFNLLIPNLLFLIKCILCPLPWILIINHFIINHIFSLIILIIMMNFSI